MNIFNKYPFLIAEIGVNFYDIAREEEISDMEAAKLMIDEAKKCGVDAVKFQSYKAETIASKNSPAYWDLSEEPTTSQFELFKKFDKFGADEYRELAQYCREVGIMFLSTPFDFVSVDYLDEFMDIYKISSSDLTNIPFIQYIASKNKPILLSTGASTLNEIKQAVKAIEDVSTVDIAIMHWLYPSYSQKDCPFLPFEILKKGAVNQDRRTILTDRQFGPAVLAGVLQQASDHHTAVPSFRGCGVKVHRHAVALPGQQLHLRCAVKGHSRQIRQHYNRCASARYRARVFEPV